MSVDLRVSATITGTYGTSGDLGSPKVDLSGKAIYDLVTGTATGQADLVFSDRRTLAASATENLDLAAALTDAFGASLTFVEVVALYIKAASGNTNDVIVGGHASAAFASFLGDATDTIKVRPGGALLLTCDAGYAVTATTADMLKITNSGGTTGVTYDVIIVGRSA